jgi:hypothetical protein
MKGMERENKIKEKNEKKKYHLQEECLSSNPHQQYQLEFPNSDLPFVSFSTTMYFLFTVNNTSHKQFYK